MAEEKGDFMAEKQAVSVLVKWPMPPPQKEKEVTLVLHADSLEIAHRVVDFARSNPGEIRVFAGGNVHLRLEQVRDEKGSGRLVFGSVGSLQKVLWESAKVEIGSYLIDLRGTCGFPEIDDSAKPST